jgi:peptide/nickel transport system substrate-binding protein
MKFEFRHEGRASVASRRRLGPAWCLLLAALIGCTPVRPAPQGIDERAAPAHEASGATKTLSIAQTVPIKGYGPWEFSSTGGGAAALAEIHTTGLVTQDAEGKREGRIAAKIPSLDDDSITVLPDGRMRTVWALRPDVRWQDGAPFTAEDVVFSWRVATHPELLSSISPYIWGADQVETAGPYTAVITYKTPFFRALDLDHRNFWLFPKHLLGDAFEGDKEAFRALPYFTSEYVNLGPFRLVDFGLGEQQVFEAFAGYFLGQPRVQRIVIHTITDQNAMIASLKTGTIDMISEKTLGSDQAVQLRDEWALSGEGRLYYRQDNWLYVTFQFDPQWARPIELSRDPRLRAALLHAIDRDAIREFALPGFPDTQGDTFVPRSDPRAAFAGEPFARYRYDRNRAAQLFAEAGWTRSGGGPLVGSDSRPVQIETRGMNQTWTKEVALIADFWRQMGIDAPELIPSPARSRDNEFSATFPGVMVRARGSGDGILVSFDSRLQATQQTRWNGANYAHYASPRLDTLIDRLERAIDVRESGTVLREIGELLASDLPAIPIYFRTAFAATRKGVTALTDDYHGIVEAGDMARNAYRWEIQ